MTREDIEKLNDVRPFCCETDQERRWYEIGLIDGLSVADAETSQSRIVERNRVAAMVLSNAFNSPASFAVRKANELMVELYGENWEKGGVE